MNRQLQSLLPIGLMSAAAIGIPLMGTSAQAAESILVRYQESEVNVTRSELNTFTETGELPPSLRTLLDTEAELPGTVATILSEQITVPKFLKNFISGSNGEFLLFKLDQVISSADGRTERGLNSLKLAVLDAIEDDRVSFMEIIDKHPQNTIRVDVTSLEGTYNDVSGFVQRILPALEVAQGVLSDFICDCKTTQVTPKGVKAQNVSTHNYANDPKAENCKELESTTAHQPDNAKTSHLTEDTDLPELAGATTQPVNTATSEK